MGPQEGDRDWVDVANELLSKCHVNLRLRKLTDCDAQVFIALYENILGERVPEPRSQEDDVHNVQSVIDSLSLDYLQISLSHITGENVIRGDNEAIRNLLEIFDGLLEYLNEEIGEELQNGGEVIDTFADHVHGERAESASSHAKEHKEGAPSSSTEESAARSGEHSWNAKEAGSTSEIVGTEAAARLALPPRTSHLITASGCLDSQNAPLTEPLYSAIPLHPPNQSNTPYTRDTHTLTAAGLGNAQAGGGAVTTESLKPADGIIFSNGFPSPPLSHSPGVSEKSLSSHQRTRTDAETLEPTNGGPKRVLFRTQPDVLVLTLPDEAATAITSTPSDAGDKKDQSHSQRLQDRGTRRTVRTDRSSHRSGEGFEEPLSHRRQRNIKAEEELHLISENLSHRLEQLDEMLKRVLVEPGEVSEVIEGDGQAPRSSSRAMGRHQTAGLHTGAPDVEAMQRLSSPSPPHLHASMEGELQTAMAEALSHDHGKQTRLTVSEHSRPEDLCHRASHRKHRKQHHMENKAYEEQLQRYEDKEQADLDRVRLKAQQAEREYREALLKDVSQASKTPNRKKTQQKTKRTQQTRPTQRRQDSSRKPPSALSTVNVKENELLPVLLEELPHLHVTPRALGRMWEQQMQQVDRLHAGSNGHRQRSRLSSELEEEQRKHDLLVEIVRKDQDHKKRLRDFKERIHLQKSTQNRLRDQKQQIARAKKYHNEYHVQHRARMMRARTKEERMFRKLFEEGLEIQKVWLREQRSYTREQQQERQRRHQDHIKSMENYYKDQFSLLAENLAQERQEIQVRKKAQEKALLKMKRELRSRMEREIAHLQKIVIENDEDDYFEDLQVQRLRNHIHKASFQHRASHLP